MTDKKWYFDTIEEAKAAMPKWKKIYKAVNEDAWRGNPIFGCFVPASSKDNVLDGGRLYHGNGAWELIEKRKKEPSKAHIEKAESIGAELVSGGITDRHSLAIDNSLPIYGSNNALSKAFNDACKKIAESIQKDTLKLRPITDFLPKQQDSKMTLQNQAKELLPFVQAMAEGKEVQFKCDGEWLTKACPNFVYGVELRIAPETIIVNGFEIEAPAKEFGHLEKFYIADPASFNLFGISCFDGSTFDNDMISRGLCHKTRAAAIAHAKAMIGIDPNK